MTTVLLLRIVFYEGNTHEPGTILDVIERFAEEYVFYKLAEYCSPYGGLKAIGEQVKKGAK